MEKTPNELSEAIKAAREALSLALDGHLLLGHRQQIWAAMGPTWHYGRIALAGEGLGRRTRLAIACVNHVLPIWEKALPDDRSPHDLLDAIHQYLRGDFTPEALNERAGSLWSLTEDLGSATIGSANSVGCAACMAASTALDDESFDPAAIDPFASDEGRDPWGWDAAFYAAIAFAGGNPISYTRQFDRDRLLGFWSWYLDVAIPSSW
jgi:Immunity protein Imm5